MKWAPTLFDSSHFFPFSVFKLYSPFIIFQVLTALVPQQRLRQMTATQQADSVWQELSVPRSLVHQHHVQKEVIVTHRVSCQYKAR